MCDKSNHVIAVEQNMFASPLHNHFYFLGINIDLCFHFEKKMETYIMKNLKSLDHLKEIQYFFQIDRAMADQTIDPATYFTDNYGLFYLRITEFINNVITSRTSLKKKLRKIDKS